MTQIRRYPYLTPSSSRVIFNNWTLLQNGEIKSLGAILPDWDPAVSVTASIPVQVDLAGVLDDCHLAADAHLRLAALWKSNGTFLRGRGDVVDLNTNGISHTLHLTVQIEGIKLAESVELYAQLILVHPGSVPSSHFSARLPGSILVQSKPHKITLEGSGARFPVEVVDFTNTRFPAEAGWYLYWDPGDLHQSVLANVRLYINSRHVRVKQAVSENGPDDFGICEAIRYDTARALIYGALENDEFVQDPDSFEQGSVGVAVRNMLRLYFPQISFDELRSNSKSEGFDAALQEKLHIFWQEG